MSAVRRRPLGATDAESGASDLLRWVPNSNQMLAQWVWRKQYLDEPVRYDRNTNVGSDDPNYPERACIDPNDGSRAYFYHQDANYRVIMLTDENGNVAERYEYDAYGEPVAYTGFDDQVFYVEVGGALALGVLNRTARWARHSRFAFRFPRRPRQAPR